MLKKFRFLKNKSVLHRYSWAKTDSRREGGHIAAAFRQTSRGDAFARTKGKKFFTGGKFRRTGGKLFLAGE